MTRFFIGLICIGFLPAFAKELPLVSAIASDNTAAAISLIDSGADVNRPNRYGVRPLSLACQNGNVAIIERLLKGRADINVISAGGETALMTASRIGLLEPVQLLIKSGAKVTPTDQKGQGALSWAAAEGHSSIVVMLISEGAKPDRVTKAGFTALHFAARNGRLDVVKNLIKAGVDINRTVGGEKKGGRAPLPGTAALMFAVENAHYEVAIELIKAGANPNDQRTGNTPLHRLTHIRKPDRGDGISGLPPPEGSGRLTSLQFARVLIEEHGANVNEPLKNGSSGGNRFGTKAATAFLLAAKKADLPYMKLLKELGADVNLTNQDGTTSLLAAAGVGSRAPEEEAGTESERIESMQWLLSLGSDLNHKNRNGETAMHGAAYKNIPKAVHWLIENGAEIEVWNVKNRFGRTPLAIARGFRPGNFKPSAATIAAIKQAMLASGVTPPANPGR